MALVQIPAPSTGLSGATAVQYGATGNSSSSGDATVTFGTPFAGTPRVVATINVGAQSSPQGTITITSLSSTSFNFSIVDSNGNRLANKTANYIAIY